MTAQTATIETLKTQSTKKVGRPVDPNSKTSRARKLLLDLPEDKFNKTYAVEMLVKELGCKESSAMTFFYTIKAEKNKKSDEPTV